jgi:hypothetical protein
VREVDPKAMAAIHLLQCNPRLGDFRIHAARTHVGIDPAPGI